ncbi:MAG: hypothetical protein ACYS19_08005 [Planctomycetota bacterium]
MSKTNSDKQGDADVLRAQDIVPPYNKKIQQNRDFQKMETDDVPAEPADVEQKKGKIPKFDLAKEIMAEQRKITAIRRKAPSKTGPIRDPKDLGPKDKGSNGAGMIEAGLRRAPHRNGAGRAQSSCVAGLGKRKQAPSPESGTESISYTIQPPPVLAEQEQIIAEIVARDIEQLCGRLDT